MSRQLIVDSYKNHATVSKAYYKKAITYGTYIEVYEYFQPRITYQKADKQIGEWGGSGNKSDFSLSRSRTNVYRICEGNIGQHGKYAPVFFTLTFGKGGRGLRESNRAYKYFISKLNRELGGRIKYIVVPEIQKERYKKFNEIVWHYHGVFFNLPKIDILKFKKIWGYGSVDLNAQLLGKSGKIRNVSKYLTKYMTKDTQEKLLFGEKSYFSSRGLLRPIETYEQYEVERLEGSANIEQVGYFINNSLTIKKYKYVS